MRWKRLNEKAKILVQRAALQRFEQKGFLRRCWDRERRIMSDYYEHFAQSKGGTKKVKQKFKEKFTKLMAIEDEKRDAFITEYFFMCKLWHRRRKDLEESFADD